MSAKLNTRDLIIDTQNFIQFKNQSGPYREYVYTLVCRADLNKNNSWILIPEVDIATFGDSESANEYQACVNQVQRYQALKYPKLPIVREQLTEHINTFRKTIAQLHANTK